MPAGRRRVLVVTRNLPPLRGGMERLNQHLLEELAVEFDVRVCCPRESIAGLPARVSGRGAPLQPLPVFLASSAANVFGEARRFRPHLVLAGSGLTAPLARLAARAAGAPAMAYLHGLDLIAPSRVYQRLWVPQFPRLDAVLVNSRHTAGLAAAAGVTASHIHLLHPGVEAPEWEPQSGNNFRQRFSIPAQSPILLSVGRLTPRKGIAEFIEAALPALIARVPSACLVIIGGEALHSLKGGGQGQRARIESIVRRLGLQEHVRLLGEVDDPTLNAAWFAARALVFPVLDLPGDVEGFGMVAVEAAAHGLHTVAFAVGGVADAVADPLSGALFPPGDYAGMTQALIRQCTVPDPATAITGRRNHARRFEWTRFGERLREVCSRVIDEKAL